MPGIHGQHQEIFLITWEKAQSALQVFAWKVHPTELVLSIFCKRIYDLLDTVKVKNCVILGTLPKKTMSVVRT